MIVNEITGTTISLTWEPPEEEFINGVLDKYVLTYQGEELDRSIHTHIFQESLDYLQSADLTGLQESTTYTITIALFASGQRSPQVKLVTRTLDAGECL